MRLQQKKALYESIMRDVAKVVKRALNEAETLPELSVENVGRFTLNLEKKYLKFVDLRYETTNAYNFSTNKWSYQPYIKKMGNAAIKQIINFLKENGVDDKTINTMGFAIDKSVLNQPPAINRGFKPKDLRDFLGEEDCQTLAGVIKWYKDVIECGGGNYGQFLLMYVNKENLQAAIDANEITQSEAKELIKWYKWMLDDFKAKNNR